METNCRKFPIGYCISCKHHDFNDDESQYCMLRNHPIAVKDCCDRYEEKPHQVSKTNYVFSRLRVFLNL